MRRRRNSTPLDLAVMRGGGRFLYDMGGIPGSGEATDRDIILDNAQTYRVNGWTIQADEHRTRSTDNATVHGTSVSVADVRSY